MSESFKGESLPDGTILKQGNNEMPRHSTLPIVNQGEKLLSLHKLVIHVRQQAPLMVVRN